MLTECRITVWRFLTGYTILFLLMVGECDPLRLSNKREAIQVFGCINYEQGNKKDRKLLLRILVC